MRPVDQVRVSIVQAIAKGQLQPGDRLPSEARAGARVPGQPGGRARGAALARRHGPRHDGAGARRRLVRQQRRRRPGRPQPRRGDGRPAPPRRDQRRRAARGAARARGRLRAARGRAPLGAHLRAIDGVLEAARDPELSAEAWLGLDVRFHRAVATSAENRVLMVPLSALHAIVQPRLNEAIRPLIVRDEIDAEHGAILAAIRDRDAGRGDRRGRAPHRHARGALPPRRRALRRWRHGRQCPAVRLPRRPPRPARLQPCRQRARRGAWCGRPGRSR